MIERISTSPQPRLNLVYNEEDVVFFTELGQSGKIIIGWYYDANYTK
jgi:hypothetical protein